MKKDIVTKIIGEEKVKLLTEEELMLIIKLISQIDQEVKEDSLKQLLKNTIEKGQVYDGDGLVVNEYIRKATLSKSIIEKLG